MLDGYRRKGAITLAHGNRYRCAYSTGPLIAQVRLSTPPFESTSFGTKSTRRAACTPVEPSSAGQSVRFYGGGPDLTVGSTIFEMWMGL